MKHIFCIGGSTGIGLATIQLLLEDGFTVTVASRHKGDLPEAVQHQEFDISTNDVSELQVPEQLDGFIYFPGSINLKPFKMLQPTHFEEDLQLNFMGAVKATHHIIEKLNDKASILYFSSVAAQTGMPYHASISASKAAIEGFTKSLAAEYAPKLRVNAIAPSLTDTPLAKRLLNNDKKIEMMKERHPLKNIGNANDIAQVAAMLVNANKSGFITGQIITVDGGIGTISK